MKIGVIVILTVLVAAFVAQTLFADPGYVTISLRGYLVETNVLILLLAIALVVLAILLAAKLFAAPRLIGEAAGRYRAGRAGRKLTRGMIALAEGNYAKGEKLLAQGAGASEAPFLNYLQAARAAHLQGRDERRDEWLRIAYENAPQAANAVLLTQAELQFDRGQYEQALATLRRLEANSREHSQALALLGRLYYRLEDWAMLQALLPRLAKQGRVSRATLDKWAVRVYGETLRAAADGEAINAAWRTIPRRSKSHSDILVAYFEALMRVGLPDRAEKELAGRLKSDWRAPLVRLYGLIETLDTSKQLGRAERWLDRHADDPDLLLTTARLCLRNELWGKARSYLETVIGLRPSPEAYQEYGHLLNQLGEDDAAARAFGDGLGMVAEAPVPRLMRLKADP